MANKVYITGASGRLGRVILSKCKAIPIVRKMRGLSGEIVSDFSTEELKKILKDADAIIHLAGSRDFLDQKKAWEGNVELSRRIVDASPKTAKIIFSSSISVYGKNLQEFRQMKKQNFAQILHMQKQNWKQRSLLKNTQIMLF